MEITLKALQSSQNLRASRIRSITASREEHEFAGRNVKLTHMLGGCGYVSRVRQRLRLKLR
jgi:hypothetical protein